MVNGSTGLHRYASGMRANGSSEHFVGWTAPKDGWLLDGTYEAYVRFPIKSLLASVALGIGQI